MSHVDVALLAANVPELQVEHAVRRFGRLNLLRAEFDAYRRFVRLEEDVIDVSNNKKTFKTRIIKTSKLIETSTKALICNLFPIINTNRLQSDVFPTPELPTTRIFTVSGALVNLSIVRDFFLFFSSYSYL